MQQPLSFALRHLTLKGIGYGDPKKPMILALHGWLDNAASFAPLAAYLDDYYLVAIDLAGHGRSSHRGADAHYHLLDYVHDIHELVESQQWSEFILLGHSMGGIIATLYASCFAQRVTKLISIESFGPMTKEASSSAQQLRDAILSRLKIQQTAAKQPKSLEQTVKARMLGADISLPSAQLLIERNIHQQNEQVFFSTDRRLRALSLLRLTDAQAQDFMQNIACPFLVILATQGFAAMHNYHQQRRSWVKNLTTAYCTGHHHVHMDNPQEVAQKIKIFLQEK